MASSPLQMRLLIDPPQDGPTNMAVDSALLELAGQRGNAMLRLYRWQPATVSLGYFQRYEDFLAQSDGLACLPVVRRCTGGGAILHADELTYSLILPVGHALDTSPEDLYTWMHQRIADALAALGASAGLTGEGPASARGGPFLCFACHARFDLLAGGLKLAGSSQRRTRDGLLQHGSVVLHRSHPIQPSSAVDELLGRPVGFDELAGALIDAMQRAGAGFTSPLPSAVPAERLAHFRDIFASDAWTRRR